MRLPLIAALQYLPPRQRVVLILRDVLDWPASEFATLLKTSTAAVNSLLQRARSQLEALQPNENEVTEPSDGTFRAHALHVLTLTGSGISRIIAFMDPRVFTGFGLPATL